MTPDTIVLIGKIIAGLVAGFYTTASSRECILEANRAFDNSI